MHKPDKSVPIVMLLQINLEKHQNHATDITLELGTNYVIGIKKVRIEAIDGQVCILHPGSAIKLMLVSFVSQDMNQRVDLNYVYLGALSCGAKS